MIYYSSFLLIFCSSFYSQTQQGSGSITLDGIGTYSQDFNSLANSGTSSTLPTGWYFIETGTNANNDYAANDGSSNVGNTYSYGSGTSTERAFGGLLSSNLTPLFGAKILNSTGYTITQLPISYTGEMWRLGTSGRDDRLDFQYSTDASSLSSGTWIDVNSLDFTTPSNTGTVGARDGNNSSFRTNISFTITGLSIPDGGSIWIRWSDFNASGADDGLAIDDFSIDESNLPVELISFTAFKLNNEVKLTWQTATEINNFGFEIERSENNFNWDKIGFVAGNGNSNSPKEYSFIDDKLNKSGKYYYRLKQLDIDGGFEYSNVIEVDFVLVNEFQLHQNYPNPFNPITRISWYSPVSSWQTLKVYDVLSNEVTTLVNEFREAGKHEIKFDASNLPSGIYYYQLNSGGLVQSKKMLLVK
jgi:hypothetical protein